MPFTMAEAPKCPACGKSVYAAEERLAGTQKYHKTSCFKCMMCKKGLELTNCCPHEDGKEIYCKQCFGRKFGPKGVGFGVGAGCMSTDTGSQFADKYYDTRSGMDVYIEPATRPYPGFGSWGHGWGFPSSGSATLPRGRPALYRPLSTGGSYTTSDGTGSYGSNYSAYDASYQNAWSSYDSLTGGQSGSSSAYYGTQHPDSGVDRGHLPHVTSSKRTFSGPTNLFGDAYGNAARQKAVDTLTVSIPHSQTVPVYNAPSPLPPISPRPTTYSGLAYHPRGYGRAIRSDQCPRCNRPVYAAEKRKSLGGGWHRQCFTCRSCQTSLDSTNCCDARGDIWCKTCYNRYFGIKGVGFGIGGGVLTTRK